MVLQLQNKLPKRKVKAKLRYDWQTVSRPNETCAMGFVHNQLSTGRKILMLALATCTTNAARALGLSDYGLAPGCFADFVLVEGEDVAHAVVARPAARATFSSLASAVSRHAALSHIGTQQASAWAAIALD